MASHYQQLCAEERACIMQMAAQGQSLRQIASRPLKNQQPFIWYNHQHPTNRESTR
ncbi:helix-turn-helix domain-containing protein [Chromobacterium paludis]|uniref:Helix-turn-helix domain-containing protein n=1 Tax=Chromobacterium paludis TaxID=2605945 RepID=A0A5C1DII0_9NEIS|nr:helix-turn-helix domain-containing protein [Chromobacterium paludis]